MAVKTFSAGSVLTASDTNTYLANAGWVYIKQVTVGTAVTTADVTSCFSATYDDYVIEYAGITATNSAAGYLYLLSGSTPTSSGFYASTYFFQPGVGGGLSNAVQSNTSGGEAVSNSTACPAHGTIFIYSPYLAKYTRYTTTAVADDYVRIISGAHKANTSYDGIRLAPSAGTWTGGTITVFGIRKG